jgi:hypothetical protein
MTSTKHNVVFPADVACDVEYNEAGIALVSHPEIEGISMLIARTNLTQLNPHEHESVVDEILTSP